MQTVAGFLFKFIKQNNLANLGKTELTVRHYMLKSENKGYC